MDLPLKSIQKLQLAQNAMNAGIDSSGQIFVATLLFPVDFWVQFKLLISTYKSLHGEGQFIFEATCSLLFLLIASDLTGWS